MSKTRHEKPAAIEFPTAPEHPRLNAELEYRLSLLRVLDATVTATDAAQKAQATSAWTRAMSWGHALLISAARESIEDLGPLASASQKAEMKEFIKSLETEPPMEAA